jgi:membrane protein implicated in regulation of membrane protease activity
MSNSVISHLVKLFSFTRVQSLISTADNKQLTSKDLDCLLERAIISAIVKPNQRGRVYYQSTWWFASCPYNVTLPVGTSVRVITRSALTLIVEPLPAVNTLATNQINAT